MNDHQSSPQAIPSAMRPSMSVAEQVKNTLLDLVSTTLNKLSKESSENGEVTQERSSNGSTVVYSRSKEGYQHRLSTFTLSFWCGKPLCLSPPLLAQYGWECIGEDIIKCCSCAAIVSMRLPWSNSTNYHQQCRKAMKQVISGHMRICSWPSNCCPDSYLYPFRLKYLTKESLLKFKTEFEERTNNLIKLGDKLPYIESKILSSMNIPNHVMKELMKKTDHEHTDNGKDMDENGTDIQGMVKLSSTLLALCGWTTQCDYSTANVNIRCDDTSRKIGLWNFHSIADSPINDAETDENEDPVPTKRTRLVNTPKTSIAKTFFHPVKQHHLWSPWVICLKPLDPELPHIAEDAEDCSNDPVDAAEEPGWSVLLKIVLDQRKSPEADEACDPKASEHNLSADTPPKVPTKTPPRAALQTARRMLQEWSSLN